MFCACFVICYCRIVHINILIITLLLLQNSNFLCFFSVQKRGLKEKQLQNNYCIGLHKSLEVKLPYQSYQSKVLLTIHFKLRSYCGLQE